MRKMICPIVALCLSAAACLLPADAKPLVVGVSDNCRRPPNVASTYYLDALAEAGHVPVLIAHCTDEARLDEVLSRVDLLLMTGGEDVDPARYSETNSASHVNAERDRFDFALMSCAVRRRLPIFGICRGCQLVNVFFGGSLVQDIPTQYVPPQGVAACRHRVGSWPEDAVNPPAHAVAIEGGSRLAGAIGGAPLAVNSHHHQCVKLLAPGFRIAARAPDGVVEAIECDTYPAAGVQFHPESLVACKPKDPSFEIARLRRILSEIGRLCESPATNYVPSAAAKRRISVEEYRDRMEAGWIGQIAGVGVGGPTEFKYCHKLVPADKVRPWSPEIINEAFHQDDLYVEMTFLQTLDRYGLGVDIRRAGIEFANSRYRLWHANAEGRDALRRGIAPPDSSHPSVNTCANDIDYQIEADYSGLVSPGCFQGVVSLGEKFGRLMNYGDGMWAGQFVGAMYAIAFFEREPRRIVESALRAIPRESRYAEMVRDLLAWHAADGADWEGAWRKIVDKYGHEGGCTQAPNNIEATLNGAMVLLGVLYGNGDPYRTIVISTRGGFDSDCNPSSAAGVIFTSIGKRDLPREYYSKLDMQSRFEYTDYDFPALVKVCEKIARQIVVAEGGCIERDTDGSEWFIVPDRGVKPSKFETFRNPGPPVGSKYTEAEMAEIRFLPHPIKTKLDDRWGIESKARD